MQSGDEPGPLKQVAFDTDYGLQSLSIGGFAYGVEAAATTDFAPVQRSSGYENFVQTETRAGYQCLADVGRDRSRTEIRSVDPLDLAQPQWFAFDVRCFGVNNLSPDQGTILCQIIGRVNDRPIISSACARIDARRGNVFFRTAGGAGPYPSTPNSAKRYAGPPLAEGVFERFLFRIKFDTRQGEIDLWRGIPRGNLEQGR